VNKVRSGPLSEELRKQMNHHCLVTSFLFLITLIVYFYHPILNRSLSSRILIQNFEEEKENNGPIYYTYEKKPILYTFVDVNKIEFDVHLLETWKLCWNKAGWDTRVLSPSNAEEYNYYDKWIKRLDESGIYGLPRMSFIRHLAMSVIKSGGFFSEYYIFPLQRATINETNINEYLTLPNDGKFISYDGVYGSFISASYEEWNRMTNLLLENIEKNVVFSFKKINHLATDAFFMKDLVHTPFPILQENQFEMDLCGNFSQEKISIRFHGAEIEQLGYDIKDRAALIQSWMRLYEGRCLTNLPLVFTFYEPIANFADDCQHLLKAWKESWSDAGFTPIVLSLQDAKRHPRYKYLLPMLDGVQFKDNTDKYNFYCFLRWVAMSTSGGGWMTDSDTFPLNIKPSFTLPNNGTFTAHAGLLPTLLSGSAPEWNRMSKMIFNNYREKMKTTQVKSWADNLALADIYSLDKKIVFSARQYNRFI